MADQTTESILFEIKINSEQYKSEQKLIRDSLAQLTLDIEKTKGAQAALKKEREAGKLTDAQYAEQSVKLREQLRGEIADQRELEKGLAISQKAYQSAAGSREQLSAQLNELTTAYYAMGEAERKSVEGQALQKQALAVSVHLRRVEDGAERGVLVGAQIARAHGEAIGAGAAQRNRGAGVGRGHVGRVEQVGLRIHVAGEEPAAPFPQGREPA
jgi:hypothetical protein